MKKLYIFLVLFTLGFGTHAVACDCDPTPAIADAVDDADMVIHGKILKATVNKAFSKTGKADDNLTRINEYEVLVMKKYKGSFKTDTLIIRTSGDSEGSCGITFEENSEVFFYAYKVGKGTEFHSATKRPLFFTSSCTRTDEFTTKEQEELTKVTKIR